VEVDVDRLHPPDLHLLTVQIGRHGMRALLP
jgi:hypothetical protein